MATDHSTVTYKPIQDFPGYRVGDDGSVWYAWVTCRSGRKLTDRWRRMKASPGSRGYLRVNLTPPEGGRYRTFRVHILVLTAFVGPCPDGMEGRHLNGIKADCRLDNLAWGTPEQNRQDNHDLGAYQKGEAHSQAKLTDEQVREIRRRRAAGASLRELADEHGVSFPCLSAIVNRKTWKHVG